MTRVDVSTIVNTYHREYTFPSLSQIAGTESVTTDVASTFMHKRPLVINKFCKMGQSNALLVVTNFVSQVLIH